MHSRGRFKNRPPHNWGRPPQNDWDSCHDNYNRPLPRQRPPGPPPPEYFNCPPKHRDERLPPHDFCNDDYYNDFDQAPPQRHPSKLPPRGRGRGQNGSGRGQSYSRGRGAGNFCANGPMQHMKEEKKEAGGKPAWLSQHISSSTGSTSSNISSSSSSTSSTNTSSSKPAWLTQVTTGSSSNSSTNQLPTNPSPTVSTSTNSSELPTLKQLPSASTSSKPAWLSHSVNNSSSKSSVSSTSKPAWMSATVKTTSATTTGPATPSNVTNANTSTATTNNNPHNNTKPIPKWLTQSSGIKPIIKSTKVSTSQVAVDADSLPPPPPPPYPPPVNQPNIHASFQQQQNHPYIAQSSIPTVVAKPVRKIKDASEVKGTIALPGQPNYISYKNTLQEFCQKRGLSVPSYKCFKNGYGFSASVEIYTGKKVHSSGIQKERKEAEQCAAFEALKNIGLLPHESQFVNPATAAKAGSKRQMPSPQIVAKKLKNEIPTSTNTPNYKAQLNEFCQKFHLPVPTYETTNSSNGYITKAMYNKKEYLSTCPQPSKRAAEMNVAQLVLSKVNQAPPPSEPIKGPVVYPNFVMASKNTMGDTDYNTCSSDTAQPNTTVTPIRSVQDLVNKNITPVISYKNKLQEACQKRRTTLPTYNTYKDGHLHCCSLLVQGQTYTATGCKTKKGAEQSAARVALEALGLLNE